MKYTSSRGFTLIELLVVISIIGLLSSVVMASLSTARSKGLLAAGQKFDTFTYRALGADAHLVWDFDEGASGTSVAAIPLVDKSGNGYTPTVSGTVNRSNDTPSGTGTSVLFDGVSYLQIPNMKINTSVTVSAWLKDDNYANSIPLSIDSCATASGPNLFFIPTVVALNTGDGGGNPFMTGFPDTRWHQVTFTIDAIRNNATLYIDGKQVGTAAYRNPNTLTCTTNNGAVFRAGIFHNGGNGYTGYMDNLRIYPQPLTSAEAEQLYAQDARDYGLAVDDEDL